MTKPTAHIEDWEIVVHPLKNYRYLRGAIAGHINQDNFRSERNRTSKLLSIDETIGAAETVNTLYTLGAKYVPV